MNDNYEQLRSKLKEIFQMDQADLDFGIYRIMNTKREEIICYLDEQLRPQVKEILSSLALGNTAEIEKRMKEIEQQAKRFKADPEDDPEYQDLAKRKAGSLDIDALEKEIFSDLFNFFSRYYEEGDFLSLRRYKADVYAIPYEGEEVRLHWANHDQYYVKTSEYFTNYSFRLPESEKRVHFRLINAETEQNNNKERRGKERRFMLSHEKPLFFDNKDLVVGIEYVADSERRNQEKINQSIIETLRTDSRLADFDEVFSIENVNGKEVMVLERHLKSYTARNTFDYFIHKDLGGFLRRELDFFLKNEVLVLDDIVDQTPKDFEKRLAKLKALKQIGHKIILFLAQLEDFQKKLWLKKKFVVETNWCITLDRVPEEFYAEIAANKDQREEWLRLFAIDEIKASNGDLPEISGSVDYSEPLSEDFLKDNPYLVLDTAFFSEYFKQRLVAEIDNLDEQTNGLLVHSENFQALSLLQEKYCNQLDAIYIDPPYNTGPSEILYKNSYLDSSWISLMHDRIISSIALMKDHACYAIAIDDFELSNLCSISDDIFTNYDRNMVVVNHHPQGGMSHNISRTHEYMLVMTPPALDILRGKAKSSGTEHRSYMLSGPGSNKSRQGRPNSFYAILIAEENNKIVGFEAPPGLGDEYPTGKTEEGYVRRYPISPSGEEKVWCRSHGSAQAGLDRGEIEITESGTIKLVVDTSDKRHNLMSNWTDSKYNSGPHGTALVADIMGDRESFAYPKSLYTVIDAVESMTYKYQEPVVLDFFAGSATTAHAVINLNREDNGDRKYILVEMAEYFDTVTKPRIQKVVYSKDWKDGKPLSRKGLSHCFKIIRLESYEDTLNNLILSDGKLSGNDLLEDDSCREQYLLSYMLDIESRDSLLDLDLFNKPFDYQLSINRRNEICKTTVDLVETFNYLIGLNVSKQYQVRRFHADFIRDEEDKLIIKDRMRQSDTGNFAYRTLKGKTRGGEQTLVIWREMTGNLEEDNVALDEYFRTQFGTHKEGWRPDVIYVNGDNNLLSLRRDEEKWEVRLIEEAFHRLMFANEGV